MPTLDLTLIICLQGLESKVSLTLDCWTSSNQWAFICIIMTYVTDDWELEEVILDFREIVGEHSGENLAEVVWQTIAAYGLENKVCQNGIMRLDLRNAKLRALSSRLFLLWLTMHQTMTRWLMLLFSNSVPSTLKLNPNGFVCDVSHTQYISLYLRLVKNAIFRY